MNFCSVRETAEKWGVSERFVRKLCKEGRIENAIWDEKTWLIPSGIEKPERKKYERKTEENALNPDLSEYAKRIVRQRIKNNHYGIYEYIQLNLTYSSNRMASNRLTRNETEEIYRTNKITSSFEPAKVDDIIETVNHFAAVRFVIDNITEPLTGVMIRKLHHILTYGTYADRKEKIRPGEYRVSKTDVGVPAKEITGSVTALIREYEKGLITLDRILDFHVHFERIRPFEDYNGRLGRLLMLKECLRHEIDPFIIDDKRRNLYMRGILSWDDDPKVFRELAQGAQARLRGKWDLFRLMEYCRPPSGRGAR
jgi:Fic family protein